MRYLVAVVLFSFLACAEDGKVYVKTDPAGAEITLVNGEGENQKLEALGKTPSLVKVPLGKVKLIFTLKEHRSTSLELDIKDTAIQKPDVVKMIAIMYNVDVLYKEEGWNIWSDGKDTGKKTPDTIELPFGDHKVTIKKEGFKDINKDVKIDNKATVEIADESVKAKIVKEQIKQEPVIYEYSGTVELAILDNNVQYLSNRNYKIINLPKEMIGLQFTKLVGTEKINSTVYIPAGSIVYLLLDKDNSDDIIRAFVNLGWQKIDNIDVTDKRMNNFIVLRKGFTKYEEIKLSSLNTFVGNCIASKQLEIRKAKK